MKISVCVITYNHAAYVEQCLRSILEQEVEYPVELIIADDCSSDATLSIIRNTISAYNVHHFAVKELKRVKNLGVAGNWSDALMQCDGDLIAVCEGDDYWLHKHKLQLQIDKLCSGPDYVGSVHNADCINEQNQVYTRYTHEGMANEISIDNVLTTNSWPTPSLLFWKKFVSEDQLRSLQTAPVIDWVLMTMLLKNGKMYYFSESWAMYRVHSSGFWSRYSETDRNKKRLEILSYIEKNINLTAREKKVLNKSRANIYLNIIRNSQNKWKGMVWNNLWKAIRYGKPSSLSDFRPFLAAFRPSTVKNNLKA